MDVESFKDQLKQLNNLAEEVEQIIIENADAAFDELTKMPNQQ